MPHGGVADDLALRQGPDRGPANRVEPLTRGHGLSAVSGSRIRGIDGENDGNWPGRKKKRHDAGFHGRRTIDSGHRH